MDKKKEMPRPVIHRLPRYLSYLRHQLENGENTVSAAEMARYLGLQEIQVRKDLAYTGETGVPRLGHSAKALIESIEALLGWNKKNKAILVGVGNLGKALIGYEGFRGAGLEIVAAFDVDKKKIGKTFHDVPVYDLCELEKRIKKYKITMGIITTPAKQAVEIALKMQQSGVLAIWNFSPISLSNISGVEVENADLYSSLGLLTSRI